jgi:hypothetical protein
MNDLAREHPLENVVDRIVDGSLGPGVLRHALARIDREPDGWKRCTLAFLEAQCWGEAFRALDATSVLGPRCDVELQSLRHVPAKLDRHRARSWRGVAAAGIVAASFALGWLSHVSLSREKAGPALTVPPTEIVAQKPDHATNEHVIPAAVDPPRPSRSVSRSAAEPATPSPAALVQTVAQIRIGHDGTGATVPILAGPGINGDWLRAQALPVSEYEQVLLERHGYQVDQRRRLLIATFADGRRVSVPIDQVEIRYTGINPL